MATTTLTGQAFDRATFESILRRRMFFTESFEIYRTASGFKGDNRGLFDYGPPGCALQANIVDLWRKDFVLEEDMLELDCTVVTPEDVFKTSGHVDKFADWMCKDPVKGEYLRADHYIETVVKSRLEADKSAREGPKKEPKQTSGPGDALLDPATAEEYGNILAQIDNLEGPDMEKLIRRFDIRNPDGNNEVLAPIPFNLMFKSSIGPSSVAPVYLRPETAQGQFLNFRKLLEYNNGAMPFASASVGKSYRNEISPRSGLLRVREFLMAEIEHFVDPEGGKQHPRFNDIQQVELPLLDKDTQLAGKSDLQTMTVGSAVQQKIIDNQTLGYFLARIFAFLTKIGVDPQKLRFRQHLPNEMAHYACDCWDAELYTSYGWIECVGCADRSAYDLTVHMRRTGEKLTVQERLSEPRTIIEWQAQFDKRALGKTFRRDAKAIENFVTAMDQTTLESHAKSLSESGALTLPVKGLSDGTSSITLGNDMLSIDKVTRTETTREYIPNVIEPSFGIGRILYSLLEHVYWTRPGKDNSRGVLSLPIAVAPTKVLLVPLSNNTAFGPFIKQISHRLRRLGVSNRVDGSGASIGKRYARNDELGTPLGITVDFDTVKDFSITLRERDSTQQVRGHQDEITAAIKKLVDGEETWKDVSSRLPLFTSQSDD